MSTLKFNKWQSIDGVTRNAVLQVVSTKVTTLFSTTSQTFVDATDMSLAITPTSSTSKILVGMHVFVSNSRTGSQTMSAFRLLRGETEIYKPYGISGSNFFSFGSITSSNTTSLNQYGVFVINFLDTPSSFSEITYKLQIANYLSSTTTSINSSPGESTITLMEIAQ
jgi:hypothetical protein